MRTSVRSAIYFAGDENFREPIAVALESLLRENYSSSDAATAIAPVFLLSVGWTLSDRLAFSREFHPVVVHDLTRKFASLGAELGGWGHITSASFLKLFGPEVLPRRFGRLIYLDGDILVRGALAPLLHLEMQGKTWAAVPDQGAPLVSNLDFGVSRWRELGLDVNDWNFNTGVLVIDSERWRATQVAQRALAYKRAFPAAFTEQEPLNAVAQKMCFVLDRKWNHMVKSAATAGELSEARIVHYAGSRKPWSHSLPDGWYSGDWNEIRQSQRVNVALS